MLEAKEIFEDIVTNLLNKMASQDRGDVLPLETIERISKIRRYEKGWGTVIKKLKRKLLHTRGIALWPVPTVGYRLCTHEEQLCLLSVHRQKRATRQLTRSHRELAALEPAELSVYQQRVRAMKMQDAIQARRLIKRQITGQKRERPPEQSIPQRPLAAST